MFVLGFVMITTLMFGDVLGGCSEYNAFECDDRCYFIELWCDGTQHCQDGRDEENCQEGRECLAKAEISCFEYGKARCLPAQVECNGLLNCDNATDELGCDTKDCGWHFKCDNGWCVDRYARCNGSDECGDNSDEIYCTECLPEKEYLCLDGSFVNIIDVCDTGSYFGIYDCADESDEIGCEYYPDPIRMCKSGWRCGENDLNQIAECAPMDSACTVLSIPELMIRVDRAADAVLTTRRRSGEEVYQRTGSIQAEGIIEFHNVAGYTIDVTVSWPAGVVGEYEVLPFTPCYYEEGCEATVCDVQ